MPEDFLEWRAEGAVRRFELRGERITVGRARKSDVAFAEDETVSRTHTVFKSGSTGWTVEDAGSANGTFVNGARLSGCHALHDGDTFQIGNQNLTYTSRTDWGDQPAAGAPARADLGTMSELPADTNYFDKGEEWAGEYGLPAPSAQTSATIPEESSDSDSLQPGHHHMMPSSSPHLSRMRQGKWRVRGVARGLELRTVENDRTLVFRVDQYDSSGNRLPAVAVQFGSLRHGNVSEGEEVAVWGTFRHGTLHARRVVNVTTGATLQGPAAWERLALVMALLFVAGVFGFVAFMIITDVASGGL